MMIKLCKPGPIVVSVAVAVLLSASLTTANLDNPSRAAERQSPDSSLEDLAFFTLTPGIDWHPPTPACERSIVVLRHPRDEQVLEHRPSHSYLGALRASPHFRTVVAGPGPLAIDQNGDDSLGTGAVYVMQRQDGAIDQWTFATAIVGLPLYHGIEILPDDDSLLVSTAAWRTGKRGLRTRGAPFRIERYNLDELSPLQPDPDRLGSHRFGPVHGQIELPNPAIQLVKSSDGSRVYALTREIADIYKPTAPLKLYLHTIDLARMVELSPPISLPDWVYNNANLPMMSLHPDERLAAVTLGRQPKLAIVDLRAGTSRTLPVVDASSVLDVAFNMGSNNHGMLAINVANDLASDERPIMPWAAAKSQVRVGVPTSDSVTLRGASEWEFGQISAAPAALDWTADGTGIVAGVYHRSFPFSPEIPIARLLSVSDDGARIETTRGLHPCENPFDVIDILTINGHMPSPTPTITPALTMTLSPSPIPASPTPSPSPTATSSRTPFPTRTPAPAYLPILLRERCLPEQRRLDVVLVLDASLSMLEPAGGDAPPAALRTKLDAARQAARAFLDALRLAPGPAGDRGDQAAIVAFNSAATLLSPLTADRAALDAAIAAIAPAPQTCIVCAVEAAAAELASGRRRADAAPVLILLTDGRSNPQPALQAVARAQAAKATGVRVYTIGLGADLDEAALRQMASGPEGYHHAPTAAELTGIYRGIAVDIPCPAEVFWAGR